LPDLLNLMVIDSFQGSQILHATTYAGWRFQYHCTALGKAFMAQWDAPMRQTIYNSCGLPQQTPNTITDIDALEVQLTQIRAQRYAVDLEENELGVNGIGTSIIDGLGKVAAAISVAGPSIRLTEDVMKQIAPDVLAAANSIAVAIGGGEQPEDSVAG